MEMNDVFEKLQELQTVLAEKYTLEKKIEETPKQLDSQEELLSRTKKKYVEKGAEYTEIKAVVEKLRAELVEVENIRNTAEKNMDTISTHREYEALDKQISEASEKEASIRKELSQKEKGLAEIDEILKSEESLIASLESDLETSRKQLETQVSDYQAQLEEFNKREAEIVPGIDQEIIYKFQRIIKRNSNGIVAVRNGVCNGCHMILPAQFANEVHDGEKILFCPYCSRILFYEETKDGEEENYSTLEETGSLSDYESDFEDSDEDEENLDDMDSEGSDWGDDDDNSLELE
jgi:hypothetical protein